MTPSPPPTPPESSRSSYPTSSPSIPALQDTPRPSLLPLALPSISQISFQADPSPPPLSPGAPGFSGTANAPVISGVPTEPSRHGKQKSQESGPSSSGTMVLAQPLQGADLEAPGQRSEPNTTSVGEQDQSKHHGKKKRTRTLTTPHQSAVLHALLAQSRFPTTAMREEVGRSIGLSARKVQVWFQNQRQKARRPLQQSTSPADRPPQFGAFTSGPSTEVGSEPGTSGVSGTGQAMDLTERQSPSLADPSSSAAHRTSLPALSMSLNESSPTEFPEHPPARTPAQEQHLHRGVPHAFASTLPMRLSEGHTSAHTIVFPPPNPHYPYHVLPANPLDAYSHPGPPARRSASPILLPPLRFDQPPASQYQDSLPPPLRSLNLRASPHSTSFASLSPSDISSSSSPLPAPYGIPPPPARHGENIPPPFTLQPEPQWDPPTTGQRPILTLHPPAASFQESSSAYSRHRTNSDPFRTLPPLPVERHPVPLQHWPPSAHHSESSTSANLGTSMRRFDPVHSVVSERERDRAQATENQRGVPRRNRHTYDFGRPSGSMNMFSVPRYDQTERESDHSSEGP